MRIVGTAAALLLSLSAFAAPSVYVLDGGAKTLARLDAKRDAIEATAPLPFTDAPTEVLAAPDGTHLLVLSVGKGANASAAIVDAATLHTSPRIDLGYGQPDVIFTGDRKGVFIFTPGKFGMGAILSRVDLATAVVSKLPLDRPADHFEVVSSDTGAVFESGGKNENGRITLVSLGSLAVTKSIALSGKASAMTAIPGSGYLYALEKSSVEVVSIAEQKAVATLSVGNDAKIGGIDEATGSLFILGANDQKNGVLSVIRGTSLAGTAETGPGAPDVFQLTADAKRAFVGNGFAVTEVALTPALAGRPPAILNPNTRYLRYNLKTVDSTSDGQRVLLLTRQADLCCWLSIADPAQGSKVGEVRVGRSSRRYAQMLFAVAATAASFSAGRADAKAHGRSSFYYSFYTPRAARNPRGAIAFGPDGKSVYVLDNGTDTVTAVNVETGARIADLDALGAASEVLLLGDRTVVAAGEKGLSLIDTASNTVSEKIDLRELHDLVVLPEGISALALSKGDVALIDGRAGKVTGRIAGFVDPVAVAWMEHAK